MDTPNKISEPYLPFGETGLMAADAYDWHPNGGSAGATDAYDIARQGIDGVPSTSDAYLPQPPQGSARVLLPIGISRAQAVATLNKRAPINEFGLPTFFVRSDLLPSSLQTLTEQEVDNACEGLFYYEGFPTLQSGTAFWHQLPHEPFIAFSLFQSYIDQVETIGIRQLDLLASQHNLPQEEVLTFYNEYAWSYRARAHDVFIVAADQKRRSHLTRKMENKHYDAAGVLFEKLLTRFLGEYDDWIAELDAKDAIDVLESLVKIQRMSLGLTGQQASSNTRERLPDGADTESIIRSITRGTGMGRKSEDSFVDKLRALTENPEDGMRIQEAILRIGYSGNMGEEHSMRNVTGLE